MNNIVKFIPKNNPDTPDVNEVEEFIHSIAKDTDQLIFLRVNTEGNISLGHTPLAIKDLIVMHHQINRYINVLLESTDEDMFYEGDE